MDETTNKNPNFKSKDEIDKYIEKCQNNIKEMELMWDKNLLYLSSGAIAISLSTFNNLNSNHKPLFLFVAWACFILSISSTLISFRTSLYSNKKAIETIFNEKEFTKSLDKITSYFDISSFVFFISGVALVAIYYGINI